LDHVAGNQAPPGHVAGEVLVRFRSGAAAAAKARVSRAGTVRSSRALPFSGLRLLRLRRGASVPTAIARLRRDPAVADAQPNNIYRLASIPNDPRFGEQWGLNDVGQVVD